VTFDNSAFTSPACPPSSDLRPIGTNICVADPLFADPDGDDDICGTADDNLRLTSGSPCIDEGDDTAVPVDILDVDGNGDFAEQIPLDLGRADRFMNKTCGLGQVDMGAYEFCLSISIGGSATEIDPDSIQRIGPRP
jgi:hypothetical protein